MCWAYVGLYLASAAFEFAYVGWARAAASSRALRTTAWSVATAGLGLVGVGGALSMPFGWAPYLAGIATGAFLSAYLAQRKALGAADHGLQPPSEAGTRP